MPRTAQMGTVPGGFVILRHELLAPVARAIWSSIGGHADPAVAGVQMFARWPDEAIQEPRASSALRWPMAIFSATP